ncbi:hypothetical protein D0Y65_006728, partial [Glycine soja]
MPSSYRSISVLSFPHRWKKALDIVVVSRCSMSYFDYDKLETTLSKWARLRTMAAKVPLLCGDKFISKHVDDKKEKKLKKVEDKMLGWGFWWPRGSLFLNKTWICCRILVASWFAIDDLKVDMIWEKLQKGIGLEIVKQLASVGIKMVLTTRNEERDLQAQETLKASATWQSRKTGESEINMIYGQCPALIPFHSMELWLVNGEDAEDAGFDDVIIEDQTDKTRGAELNELDVEEEDAAEEEGF